MYLKSLLNQLYAQYTGKTVEDVTGAMERDNFMSAQGAIDFGLVDHIMEQGMQPGTSGKKVTSD